MAITGARRGIAKRLAASGRHALRTGIGYGWRVGAITMLNMIVGGALIAAGAFTSLAGRPRSWERLSGLAIAGIGVAVVVAAYG